MRNRGQAARGVSPPAQIAEVKALACELPAEQGVPLSRWSSAELAREAVKRGIVAEVSGTTVWRWLAEDAIRPWSYRSWIFPRDPQFAEKACRVLDLYEGRSRRRRGSQTGTLSAELVSLRRWLPRNSAPSGAPT